jgi:transglutaminase-like putative cysteine protease
MTTTPPTATPPRPPPRADAAPSRTASGPGSEAYTSATAGLAVALAATALSGVLSGPRWFPFALVTIAVVIAVGMLLRTLQLPPFAVASSQLAALVALVIAVFTRSGVLVVLPGPDAVGELGRLFARAGQQIHVGVPPVPESTELLCLVVMALGLVTLAVDTVAVSMAAPAASGLVLLCVLAVPASLDDRLLPWWSFALGVLGFALLLTVDRQRRHLVWGEPAGPGGHAGATRAAIAVSAGATAAALVAGAALTGVGTEGRLLGVRSHPDPAITGIGLNPFTSLRGQLDTGEVVELFRVRGLTERAYLRALTLSRFADQQGWRQGPLDGAVPADGGLEAGAGRPGGTLPLPVGVTRPVPGPQVQVQIEPVGYVDNWLPSFGYPLKLDGVGADWRYDPDAITVFSDRRQHAEPYTELGVLPQPDPARLRATGPAGTASFTDVDPQYLDTGGVDPKVAALAAEVTAKAPTAFDAALALNRWFTTPDNGFRYDLRTAPGSSGNALVDFLVTGRAGYCEQFASAMAIMLRTLGVPARVAVGFTSGTADGEDRLITTADAHAWVEAWFPGSGWLPFDPTPLSDGRTVLPRYLDLSPAPRGDTPAPQTQPPPRAPDVEPSLPAAAQPGSAADDGGVGMRTTIGLSTAAVLLLALVTGFAPLAVRRARRRRRLQLVGSGGPQAASAAWEELLAESADRGVTPLAGETVRSTARRLVREHGLDELGQDGLRTLVLAVERSWYADGHDSDEEDPQDVADALDAARESMQRCAPSSRRARLLPRSVLRR